MGHPSGSPFPSWPPGRPPDKRPNMIPYLAMLFGASPLKVGDKAPDFTLPDTDNRPVELAKLLEKGPVILAFYVKAFTPG